MPHPNVSSLFEPLTINRMTLPNRFVMPAMQRGWCVDGVPLPKMADYYRERAEGGAGLIISEACAIDHPSATGQNPAAHIFGPAVASWARCVRAVKDAGGHMIVQLWHEGSMRRQGVGGPSPDAPTLSPSGLVWEGRPNGQAATQEDLDEIVRSYVRAAQTAQNIGADGVELHGAHGFLLDQFLWHETNKRADRWGGPNLAAKASFPCEVVRAVRAATDPDFTIGWRFSQWKEVDFGARVAHSPAELGDLLRSLQEAGVDMFHASTRRFHIPEWPDSDLGLAGWASRMTDLPVIAIGCVGIENDLYQIPGTDITERPDNGGLSELVRRFDRGDFALVAVGRAMIGDAQWVNKIRDGRYDAIAGFDAAILEQVDWDSAIMMEGLARAGIARIPSLRGGHMNSDTPVDIDELMDGKALNFPQAYLGAILLPLFFFTNFCLQLLAMAAPAIAQSWGISPNELAAPMAAGWLGSALGSFGGGLLGDRIGRRNTVLAMALVAGWSTIATKLAGNPTELIVLRALAGFGLGGLFPPALALLTECLPTKLRGLAVSAAMLCGPLGISACALFSSATIPTHGWALPFLAGGGALLALFAVQSVSLAESPRYLARLPGRRAQLSRAMRRLGIKLDPHARIAVPPLPERGSIKAVFQPEFRSISIRVWLSFFSVFLVVSALLSWLPVILMNKGYPAMAGGEAVSAWSLGGITGTLLSGACLGRWGARRVARTLPILVGTCLVLLTVFPLGPQASRYLLLGPLFFMGLGQSGMMTALYAFVAGLYPAEIRSTGVGMADMIGRATAVIAAYAAVFLLDAVGFYGFFVVLALVTVMPLALLTETRPRTAQASA